MPKSLRIFLAAACAIALPAAPPALAQPLAGPDQNAAPATPPATAALKLLPKPSAPSKSEAEFLARLDKALAPIRNYSLSADDATRVRDAIAAISAGQPARAATLSAEVQDPVGQKLIAWFRLRGGYGTAPEYNKFLTQNPAWPDRKLMTQRLEEALFKQPGDPAAVNSYFGDAGPETGAGMAALASAYQAAGDTGKARELARKAWREMPIPANLEGAFLSRFGAVLTPADHKWKLDRLIIDEVRWQADRKERAAIARRVIALLPEADRAKAQARLNVFLTGGKAAPEALGEGGSTDWGVVFHRIQSLRKGGQAGAAAQLLLTAPTDPAKIVSPDEWWVERRANAYEALKAGKARLAYDLVKDAGPLTVNPLKEQQFMAGWLALRYLKAPEAAQKHFTAMKAAADGPLSRAKASYWLGRTAEARGDTAAATDHYRAAMRESDTFHGLLAMQKLSPGRQRLDLKPPASPTQDQIARFVALDAVKAVGVARKAAIPPHILKGFVVHLRTIMQSEAEVAMVAHLAEAIGDTQLAVQSGKAAIGRGLNMVVYAYPVHPFPAYTPLRRPPEPAYLLGIARQETEFNRMTVSGAGAKGLLQVMTVTANHVCRDYKIKCDIPRLMSDISYNTMIASAYISDRMDEFSGSYILGAAGYNAGPGRARQWIREFGDPRDPKVDPIDWIERIPIQETREYVSKVLANIQMYRARLGQEPALRLDEDLQRGRSGRRPPAAEAAASDG
jgi:soluble lytic murein transglycosylase